MEYLYILQQALVWIVTIFWLYQLVVSICSLIKLKDKPILEEKQNRFMAIIPAHNEAAVVRNLIESLKNQDYPKDLYDIYVIADNCTDNTAQIARDAGAIVFERFDDTKKTKGYALQWFLKQKIEEDAPYDAFCVFDADNIADVNFLKAMNKKLCQGENVVQGYRDIKNPTDNWITAGYALFYWTMHRFYHLARYNVGLSPLLNGTGFKQSWSQRSRWTVGHIQCMKEYTGLLALAVKEKKTLMNLDGLLYIIGSIPLFIATIILLLSNFIMYAANAMTGIELWLNIIKYVLPTFFIPIATAIFTMYLEKKPIKPMAKWFIYYPLFLGSWLLINAKCIFKQDTNWEKIEHVRDIKIKEIA